MSDSSINLEEKLSRVAEHWRPKIICELNDYEVKVAKFKGDFVWHQHDDTDELFLCLQGELLIELRDGGLSVIRCSWTLVTFSLERVLAGLQLCCVAWIRPLPSFQRPNIAGEPQFPSHTNKCLAGR